MRSLARIVGLIVLVLFAGELSPAVGSTIGIGFAMFLLAATVLVARWRRRGRE